MGYLKLAEAVVERAVRDSISPDHALAAEAEEWLVDSGWVPLLFTPSEFRVFHSRVTHGTEAQRR